MIVCAVELLETVYVVDKLAAPLGIDNKVRAHSSATTSWNAALVLVYPYSIDVAFTLIFFVTLLLRGLKEILKTSRAG